MKRVVLGTSLEESTEDHSLGWFICFVIYSTFHWYCGICKICL